MEVAIEVRYEGKLADTIVTADVNVDGKERWKPPGRSRTRVRAASDVRPQPQVCHAHDHLRQVRQFPSFIHRGRESRIPPHLCWEGSSTGPTAYTSEDEVVVDAIFAHSDLTGDLRGV